MRILSTIKQLVPQAWREGIRSKIVQRSIHHVSGAREVELAPNELAVCCLVKNGEYYIDEFIEHYKELGCKHIFFLDNGSSDGTLEEAARHDFVSVYRSNTPVASYQRVLKREFALRVVPSGWCLDVDIDEFFDYPKSETVSLAALLEYLNDHKFTAVVTQMLDMFSDRPMRELQETRKEEIRSNYRFCDLTNITAQEYANSKLGKQFGARNQLPKEKISLLFGGIRKTLYGLDCLLTKHSLFRTGQGVTIFDHVHFVNGAKIADFSALLFHFKLVSSAFQLAKQNQAAFTTNQAGYENFIAAICRDPEARLVNDLTFEFESSEDMVHRGFLFASSQFEKWADDHDKSAGAGCPPDHSKATA